MKIESTDLENYLAIVRSKAGQQRSQSLTEILETILQPSAIALYRSNSYLQSDDDIKGERFLTYQRQYSRNQPIHSTLGQQTITFPERIRLAYPITFGPGRERLHQPARLSEAYVFPAGQDEEHHILFLIIPTAENPDIRTLTALLQDLHDLAFPSTSTTGNNEIYEPSATFVFTPGGAMSRILEIVESFAPHGSPVLITGETGTGKEQVARMIHGLSGHKGRMVAVNCAAIPRELIENELFGHEKGAYTGALEDSSGLVARAAGGTLFLDEIGELALRNQVKILRLIQEGEYERIGSSKTLNATARFIFATNRDLQKEVQSGSFRMDLYYRIATFEVRLPPLRERKEDIPLLVDHFLWLAKKKLLRSVSISSAALHSLPEYSWPGNVRELENLIMRLATLSETGRIEYEDLPEYITEGSIHWKQARLAEIKEEKKQLEKSLFTEAIQLSGGHTGKTAAILGISRTAVLQRLKKWQSSD